MPTLTETRDLPDLLPGLDARAAAPGTAAHVRYTIAPTAVGQALVAQSARGVCAILLGDDTAALVAELRAAFPRARLEHAPAALAPLHAKIRASLEDPARGWDEPLDVGGTPFQRSVWRALREIPAGRTASYAEVARAIGRPAAVRAVARACAANVLASAIPCHRVVRADGGLSGYRWGAARKAALLEREARP